MVRTKCCTLYGPDSNVYSVWSRLGVLHSVFYSVWSRYSVLHSVFYSVRSRLKCSTLYGPDSSVLLCMVQTQVFCTKLLCICVLLVEHIKDPWAVGNWQIKQELFCSCNGKTDRYSPQHHMRSVSEHPVQTLVDRATLLWEHAQLTHLSRRDQSTVCTRHWTCHYCATLQTRTHIHVHVTEEKEINL